VGKRKREDFPSSVGHGNVEFRKNGTQIKLIKRIYADFLNHSRYGRKKEDRRLKTGNRSRK